MTVVMTVYHILPGARGGRVEAFMRTPQSNWRRPTPKKNSEEYD
jgi:hypothetical protein